MNFRRIISFLLFIAMAGIFLAYYIQHREDFYIISTVSVHALLIMVLLSFCRFFLHGVQLKIVTDHYNINLNFSQCFGLLGMSTFANLWIPFAGGASLKAIYLKKFHNLPYSCFLASVGIVNVIKLLLNCLIALFLLGSVRTKPGLLLLSVAGSIFVCTVVFLLFAHKINTRYFSFFKHLKDIIEAWRNIRKDFSTLKRLTYVTCAIFFISSVNIFFAFRAFSVEISLFTSGIIAVFTTISSVFNLMPGNLGIREALVILISGIDGIGVNEGFHAAALSRIVSTLLTLILMPFLSRILLQKSGREIINP